MTDPAHPPEEDPEPEDGFGRDWVAIVLAVALGTAVNIVTVAVLLDALLDAPDGISPALSENATQLLTAAFGGIVGILGAYLGYRAATRRR